MARKRYKPEEIVGKLRQAEVLHGQGMSMADVQGSRATLQSQADRQGFGKTRPRAVLLEWAQ